jgi:hypothetical protein
MNKGGKGMQAEEGGAWSTWRRMFEHGLQHVDFGGAGERVQRGVDGGGLLGEFAASVP